MEASASIPLNRLYSWSFVELREASWCSNMFSISARLSHIRMHLTWRFRPTSSRPKVDIHLLWALGALARLRSVTCDVSRVGTHRLEKQQNIAWPEACPKQEPRMSLKTEGGGQRSCTEVDCQRSHVIPFCLARLFPMSFDRLVAC